MSKKNTDPPEIRSTPVPDEPFGEAMMDDVFWLQQAKDWVSTSTQNIIGRSVTIQNSIAWFFGISSAGTLIAISLDDADKKILLWLFAPLILFLVAYALQVWVQTAVYRKKTYLQSPELIKRTHFSYIRKSKYFIGFGAAFTVLSFVSVPVILLCALVYAPAKQPVPYVTVKPLIVQDSISRLLVVGKSIPSSVTDLSVILQQNGEATTLLETKPQLIDSVGTISWSLEPLSKVKVSMGGMLITQLTIHIDSTQTEIRIYRNPLNP